MDEELEETKPKKRFKLFDSQREGKEITEDIAKLPPNLKKFFMLFKRDFTRLVSVNLLMVLGNFPLIFIVIALSGAFSADFVKPASDFYPVFSGLIAKNGFSSPLLALNGIVGHPVNGSRLQTGAYIFLALGALILFTWGLVNVGVTYVMRNMVKGEPVFVFSDFFYAVKRNFRQAFFFGMADVALLVLIPFNVFYLSSVGNGFWTGILFWLNILFGFIYLTMRSYIYIQMVTFNMKIRKILKNALIFAFLGFKRNIAAFFGTFLLILLDVCLAYSGVLLSLAIILPIVCLWADCSYMAVYAAYYKIKELIIDPYYKEHPKTD